MRVVLAVARSKADVDAGDLANLRRGGRCVRDRRAVRLALE